MSVADLTLLNEIRQAYEYAENSMEYCQKGLKLIRQYPADEPVVKGYKAAFKMVQASHELFPFSKMMLFEEGRQLLEQQVKRDPASLELRFLRLSIQHNVPTLLGYTAHIREDKQRLLDEFPHCTDPNLRKVIVTFVHRDKKLTPAEKAALLQPEG